LIAIVNYGLGNIQALVNIYRRLNIPVAIADRADELRGADKIILPGVGAFDWAMTLLNESGMRKAIDEFVIEKRKPVLGICVGMQMMAQRSDEGILDGLGWIDAEVRRFDQSFFKEKMQLPHMGWNDVVPKKVDGLFRELENGARFYFLHSYYVLPSNPEWVLAVTNYDAPFASSVCAANVYGVQFHPEKSHQWGIQLLKNFAEL